MVIETISAIRLLWTITKTQPSAPVVGVCLEGDTTLRLKATARLYAAGKLSRIIVSGGVDEPENDQIPADEMVRILAKYGVDGKDIDEPDMRSRRTDEQAINVSDHVQKQGYQELLIISSGYHLLRAYLTFLKTVCDRGEPYRLYGYHAGSLFSWFQPTRDEGRRRFHIFFKYDPEMQELSELQKIQTYEQVASIEQGWKYIQSMRPDRRNRGMSS